MSDQHIASIGRDLATALNAVAKSRSEDDKKKVALLHTDLCRACREEEAEPVEQDHVEGTTN